MIPKHASLVVVFAIVSGFFAHSLLAQDIIVSELSPVSRMGTRPPPDTPAAFKEKIQITNLKPLEDVETCAYTIVYQIITKTGEIKENSWIDRTTHFRPMRGVLPEHYKTLQFEPAMLNDAPVEWRAWYSIIYNPASAPAAGPDAAPRLLRVAPVLIPNAVWAQHAKGSLIWAKAEIDETGRMLEYAIQPESKWPDLIREYIDASLEKWAFAPARKDGKAVAGTLLFPIRLELELSSPLRRPAGSSGTAKTSPARDQSAAAGSARNRSASKTPTSRTPASEQPPPSPAERAAAAASARAMHESKYVAEADASIVELPTYSVRGERILPPPESWRYAEIPGLEILSNASSRSTRKFMEDVQQYRMALRVVWPELVDTAYRTPTLFILCGRLGSIENFRPKTMINATRGYSARSQTSYFAEDSERSAIVIDYAALDEASKIYIDVDPYKIFYRQYARFLIRRSSEGRQPPVWFEEGMARLIDTIDFSKKYIEFGKIDLTLLTIYNQPTFTRGMPGNSSKSNSPRIVDTDGNSPPKNIISFELMFSNDPRVRMRERNWSNQCYAFTHMCMYGGRDKYKKGYMKLVERAYKEPVTEELFMQCFGRTYKQMALELRGYLGAGSHKSVLFTAKKGTEGLPDPKPVAVRDATQAEAGRIKGEVLRLGGRMRESRDEFIVAYLRGERDPALLASLGLLESLEKREDRAVKFLEAASKAGAVRPRAYYELAKIRYHGELKNADHEGALNEAQVASVLEPLMTAFRQQPPMANVYLLLGDVFLRSASPPTSEQLGLLVGGLNLFPHDANVGYKVAQVLVKQGMTEQARRLLQIGLQLDLDPAMRKKFETLFATLSPASN